MKSWVVLCGSPVDFNVENLKPALDDAFPGQFVPARDDGSFVVGGPAPDPFLIKSTIAGASGLFMLLTACGAYVEEEWASTIRDPALRRLAVAQRAWLSIDLANQFDDEADVYQFIGPALARLAPQDAAVLLHPTRPIIMAFDAQVRRWLAADGRPDNVERVV